MPVEFYTATMSPFCRSVWMALEELGVPYEQKLIDIAKGEQKTEDFKAINFCQAIPAIKDEGFCLGESRAIMAYLCNKYEKEGKASPLYPCEPKARAAVDCCLYRDMTDREKVAGYLNITGVFRRGEKDLDKDKVDDVKKYLSALEGFLTEHKFAASDHLTIADFTVYITVSLLLMSEEFETLGDYPKIAAWRESIEKLPYYGKTCEEPATAFKAIYRQKRGLE